MSNQDPRPPTYAEIRSAAMREALEQVVAEARDTDVFDAEAACAEAFRRVEAAMTGIRDPEIVDMENQIREAAAQRPTGRSDPQVIQTLLAAARAELDRVRKARWDK